MSSTAWLPYIAAAVSIYPLVSCVLLRHPLKRFVHPRARYIDYEYRSDSLQLRTQISSHRGGAAEAPENTLAAFKHSEKIGVDLFEMDVHLTKDKQVVVYHDHTVDRISADPAAHGPVSEFNLADIPAISPTPLLPPPFHAPAGRLTVQDASSQSLPSDATRAPSLEEVFQSFPRSQCMNIDIKADSDELIEQTCTLIEKYGRTATTIVGSGKDQVAQRIYTRNPNIPMFFSARQIALLYLKYVTGVLPFTYIKETALEIPLLTQQRMQRVREHGTFVSPGLMTRAGLCVYSWLSTSPSLIRHLQARNIHVIYWVLNEEDEFEAAYNAGADGVMTDAPTKLSEYILKRRKQQAIKAIEKSGKETVDVEYILDRRTAVDPKSNIPTVTQYLVKKRGVEETMWITADALAHEPTKISEYLRTRSAPTANSGASASNNSSKKQA